MSEFGPKESQPKQISDIVWSMQPRAWLTLCVLFAGCAESGVSISLEDSSVPPDAVAPPPTDSGLPVADASLFIDANSKDAAAVMDSEVMDAQVVDSGKMDAGPAVSDANVSDANVIIDAEPTRDAGFDAGIAEDASTLMLTPNPLIVTLGTESTISVNAAAQTSVTWSVEGVPGGTAST